MKFVKKGQWNFIISAIIVIILLFGASYFFTTTSWKGVRGFFGINVAEDVSEAVFGGCVPEVCSVRALTCAINSVSIGAPGWLEPHKDDPSICPPGYTVSKAEKGSSPSGFAAFTAMVINKITGKAGADVYELNLPLITLKNDKDEQLFKAVIDCYKKGEDKKFKESVHCSKVAVSEDFSGQLTSGSFDNSFSEYCEKLSGDEKSTCIEVQGKGVFNPVNYVWRLGLIEKGQDNFYLCTKGDDVYLTRDPNTDCPSPNPLIGRCKGAMYGDSCVECTGKEGAIVKLGKDNAENIKKITKSIIDCYNSKHGFVDSNVRCADIDASAVETKIMISEIQSQLVYQGWNNKRFFNIPPPDYMAKSIKLEEEYRNDPFIHTYSKDNWCIAWGGDEWPDILVVGDCTRYWQFSKTDLGFSTIQLGKDNAENVKKIGEAIINCYYSYEHYTEDENIKCAGINVDKLERVIRQSEIQEYLKNKKFDKIGITWISDPFFDDRQAERDLESFKQYPYIDQQSKGICIAWKGRKDAWLGDALVYLGDCARFPERKFDCTVNSFELRQPITPAEEWISGYGDPETLVYYEKFPEGEDAVWHFESSTIFMVGLGVRTFFTLIPFVKSIPGVKQVIATGAKVKTFIPWTHANRISKINKLTASLSNPNLAKETSEKITKKIFKLISKTGDDGLMAFSAALIKGQKGVVSSALTDDIVNNVAKRVNDLRKGVNVVSEPAIEGTQIGMKVNYYDSTKLFKGGRFTDESKGILLKEFENSLREAVPDISDDIAKASVKSFDEALSTAKEIDNIGDMARASLSKAEGSLDDVAKKAVEEGLASNKIKILKKVGFERVAKAHFSENSAGATAELLKKAYPSLKKIKDMDPAVYQNILNQMDDTMKSVFGQGDDIANLLLKADADKTTKVVLAAMADDTNLIKALEGTVVSGTSETIRKGMKTGIDFLGKEAGLIRTCLFTTRGLIAGGAAGSILYLSDEDGEKAVAAAVGTAMAANIKGCFQFLKYNYIPMLAGVSYIIAKEDAKNQKFIPLGTNKLGVAIPNGYEDKRAGEIASYDLKAENFFLSLIKENSASRRFYLASPCKSDVIVSKDYISCDLNNGDFVYTFEDEKKVNRFVPIEPPRTSSKSEIEPYYGWEKASDEDRLKYVEGRYFGQSWYSFYTPGFEDYDAIHKVVISNPSYLKTAYRFAYNVYGGVDHSYFYDTLKAGSNLAGNTYSRHVIDKDNDDYPLVVEYLNNKYPTRGGNTWEDILGSNPIIRPDNPTWKLVMGDYDKLIKKIKQTLGAAEIPSKILGRKPKIINRNFECYEKFLDALVDFDLKYDAGDKEKFEFTCNNEKPLEIEGFFIRYLMEELERGATDDAGEGGLCKYFCSRKDSREYDAAKTYNEYLDFLKTFYIQKTISSKLDWDKKDTWDDWFTYYNTIYHDVGPGNGIYTSGFFDHVAKQAAHHIYIYNGDRINVTKKCSNLLAKDPPMKDEDGYVYKIALKTTIPDMAIRATQIDEKYRDYNDGKNFCYSDASPMLQFTSDFLNYASIIGGLVLIPFTGGSSTYLILASVELGAIATDYVLEKCGKWPNHQATFSGCFG